MKENILEEKSFNFDFRIVEMYKYLQNEKEEFVMNKQLVRSGISVDAMAETAKLIINH